MGKLRLAACNEPAAQDSGCRRLMERLAAENMKLRAIVAELKLEIRDLRDHGAKPHRPKRSIRRSR